MIKTMLQLKIILISRKRVEESGISITVSKESNSAPYLR